MKKNQVNSSLKRSTQPFHRMLKLALKRLNKKSKGKLKRLIKFYPFFYITLFIAFSQKEQIPHYFYRDYSRREANQLIERISKYRHNVINLPIKLNPNSIPFHMTRKMSLFSSFFHHHQCQ